MKSKLFLTVILAAALSACGGGGGDTTSVVSPGSSTLSGVAATGRLMVAGTPVVAMDRTGKTVRTTVDAQGQYTLDASGMSFPILLKATESDQSLYSVVANSSEATGKININQLTHMAVVGLLGDGSPSTIESEFQASDAAAKLTADLLHAAALSALSQLPESVLTASGLLRSSLRDIRTQADFQVGVAEDKLLDQLQPSLAAGKVVLGELAALSLYADAVVATKDATALAGTASLCKGTSDTLVYETKDVVVYGIHSATSDDKLRAARGTQRALDEIKAQLQLTPAAPGIGVDGTNKVAVCVDGTLAYGGTGHLNEFSISAYSHIPSDQSASDWYKMLKHEMVHTVQAGLLGTPDQNTVLPLWFTEGMATYLADQEILDTVDNLTAWSTAMSGCVPATVSYYDQTTNCPISDFGEIYRGYGAIFASLFDSSRYGGAGNPLTKLRDLHVALAHSPGINDRWSDASAEAFSAAFDALGLQATSGSAAVSLATLQTDAGWKALVTPYFAHNTITVTVTGASNLQGMALNALDDSGNSLSFADVIANNTTGQLSVRRVQGPAAFLVKVSDVVYQSPTAFLVPASGTLTLAFNSNTWKRQN